MKEITTVDAVVKKSGEAYYFSHETIHKFEQGLIEWVDASGNKLTPKYFGAGLHGMNGTLEAV